MLNKSRESGKDRGKLSQGVPNSSGSTREFGERPGKPRKRSRKREKMKISKYKIGPYSSGISREFGKNPGNPGKDPGNGKKENLGKRQRIRWK